MRTVVIYARTRQDAYDYVRENPAVTEKVDWHIVTPDQPERTRGLVVDEVIEVPGVYTHRAAGAVRGLLYCRKRVPGV